jgi:alpha-glucosidase (family GH31 glycosyl hydrolase)
MKLILYLGALLLCLEVQAQSLGEIHRTHSSSARNRSVAITPVGDYQTHTMNNGVLEVSAANGKLQFVPYLPETVRITFIPTGTTFRDTSYSVVLDPGSLSPGIVENPDYLIFSTGELHLIIHKYPVQVSFVEGTDTIAREDVGSYALSGGQGVRFALELEEMLYGGGSRALPVNRRGFEFDNYNQPRYGYGNWESNLNISIPVILSSENFLLFFDNSYPGHFDLGASEADVLDYYCESGPLSYFFITGEGYDQILEQYTLLTGRQPLPPLWSLGYIQSRFGYENESHARMVMNAMREQGFPVDAIVLDLYWYGGVGDMCDMVWDYTRFPDPVGMMADFREEGIKTILIGETYFTQYSMHYNYLSALDYLCTDASGNTYVLNSFWAGPAGLLDLTRPATFDWMWNYYNIRNEEGVAGWWSDLGEPEQHPDDMVHYRGTAREVHNIYSMLWAQGLFNKYAEHYPGIRLFNLTRSGYAGMQRYSTIPWSGDVSKSWEGFQAQIPIMLGMGLNGVAYMGSDLGGFTGSMNEELYTRWMQFGCFSPVMRPHGANVTTEPVFISGFYRNICKEYVLLRYRLLPYTYSLAWLNSQTGRPLALPMNYFDPSGLITGNLSDQYFWGENLLVAPVMESGQQIRPVYFPDGVWIDFHTNQTVQGEGVHPVNVTPEAIPVFVKGGSFIPMATPMLSTDFYHRDTLVVWYYPDKSVPLSTFKVYQDDGYTKGAYELGSYELITLSGDTGGDQIQITMSKEGHGYSGAPSSRQLIFEVKRIKKQPENVTVDDTEIPLATSLEEFNFLSSACFWEPSKEILHIHFQWLGEAATLVINGAGLGTDDQPVSPATFELLPPAPNPFSDHTFVRYKVSEPGDYVLRIQTLEGKLIMQENMKAERPGLYEYLWEGKDGKGRNAGNGIYMLSISNINCQTAAIKLIRIVK